jgi:hypothetical protein
MPEFGFVGAAYQAASLTQEAQECINWYPEVDMLKVNQGASERGVVALYPTPGLITLMESRTQEEVRAMRVLPGGNILLAVIGNKLKSIDHNFVETEVGILNSATGHCSITDNGHSAYITDGGFRYYYTWGTGVFAVIADGGFTGGGCCDFIDNFIVYNNPFSNQFGSTAASTVSSGGLSYTSTFAAPGNIVGLIVDHREVFVIGEQASEVWVDAGLFPFPFQILPGSNMQHGCVAVASIARLGESFAFISQDTRGQGIVVQMNGYSAKRISTHAIETAFARYSTISDAVGYTYQQAGHEFYVLSFPSADVTWCYDLATELWHRRASRDKYNILHRHRSNCSAVFQGKVIAGDFANGKIYEMSLSAFDDDGVIFPCVRTAPHIVSDLRRQAFESLQVQFQPGVGIKSGQGSDPQAILEWSEDGGFTYGNQHFTSLGKMGQYKNRAIWRQLGAGRDKVFKLTVTDPVYRVVVSSELRASPLAH